MAVSVDDMVVLRQYLDELQEFIDYVKGTYTVGDIRSREVFSV